ncbi:hypothetical protein AVEN_69400-1 [Araneus ventricosus]|uniref:Uncharacterized protein n=1 Tax=Araneus ventricosus TaxID=182803 RepID=A0A4Y2RAP7_ARAVE|nr:hypothetical protein AVEN_69400-1 [Araneus ventricosus]
MERDLKLKEFAGELFSYIYREYNSTFDLPVKLPHVFNHHAAENFSEDEGKAVLKLCMALRSVFSGAFTKAFPQIQKSVKHFMTFLTSRCLKLCGDDLFLSFLMICAFIAELNLFCWINGCFAFMNTAPKCLIAIFNRRLNKEFYANGGWDKLKLFCESFVQTNGNGADSAEYSNDDFINQDLLSSIEELLDQNSSSEEDSSLESDESSPDEMEDESNAEESDEEVAPSQDKVDEEEEDEEEEDSDEESSMESDESDSESEESTVEMPGNLNHETMDGDSDDESESSEEDPSSMSAEESESEDSESDTAPDAEQINCIKPVMQENLSIEKKIL